MKLKWYHQGPNNTVARDGTTAGHTRLGFYADIYEPSGAYDGGQWRWELTRPSRDASGTVPKLGIDTMEGYSTSADGARRAVERALPMFRRMCKWR